MDVIFAGVSYQRPGYRNELQNTFAVSVRDILLLRNRGEPTTPMVRTEGLLSLILTNKKTT